MASIRNIKIIDVDTHLSEPADLWTSRATPKYRDRVPQMRKVGDHLQWMIDGQHEIGIAAASVVYGDGSKARHMGFTRWNVGEVHPACSRTRERVKLMDESGIWAQIVYPNVLGFGGQLQGKAATEVLDADLRLVCSQIYNDALAEMQAESQDRLLPMAMLPWWDVKQAVAEAERCHAMGLRGVCINSDPHAQGMRDLSDDYWTPLWEICSDKNLPVNFHIGGSASTMDWFGSSPWPSLRAEGKMAVGSTMMFISNARVICNLITSGLLERFPRLKFVSVESGIGWIPFVLEALEYEIFETGTNLEKKLTLSPLDYFRRQIFACFWFEKQSVAKMIREVGVNNCMFETDFPHPTCLYPNPLESAIEGLAGLNDEERHKVLSGNAATLYNITLN